MTGHPIATCSDPRLLCPQHDRPFYPVHALGATSGSWENGPANPGGIPVRTYANPDWRRLIRSAAKWREAAINHSNDAGLHVIDGNHAKAAAARIKSAECDAKADACEAEAQRGPA